MNRTWFDKTANEKKEECTFVDITLFGRTAEVAGEYLAKGSQVLIEGRLQLDQWTDKESGQKRQKLKVVGESMTMLGSKNGGGQQSGGESRSAGSGEPRRESSPASAPQNQPPTDYGSPGDEVPF